MKIAILHAPAPFSDSFYQQLSARLSGHALYRWEAGKEPPADDFELVITTGKFSAKEIKTQTRLQLILTASAGYDGIDVAAAKEKNILVAYAPSGETGNAVSVAEFAVLLILGASRKLNQMVAPGAKGGGISQALYGKTACIVGLGEIGRLVARRLKPFGVKLTATDDHPKDAPKNIKVYPSAALHDALSRADYVVLCIRATPENENLIDADAIKAMKKGAILVNIARGSLIDEQALAKNLQSGHIGYAGLDVVKDEPLKPGQPLLKYPEVLLTPHIAGTTDLSLEGMVDYISKTVKAYIKGKKPKARVDY